MNIRNLHWVKCVNVPLIAADRHHHWRCATHFSIQQIHFVSLSIGCQCCGCCSCIYDTIMTFYYIFISILVLIKKKKCLAAVRFLLFFSFFLVVFRDIFLFVVQSRDPTNTALISGIKIIFAGKWTHARFGSYNHKANWIRFIVYLKTEENTNDMAEPGYKILLKTIFGLGLSWLKGRKQWCWLFF